MNRISSLFPAVLRSDVWSKELLRRNNPILYVSKIFLPVEFRYIVKCRAGRPEPSSGGPPFRKVDEVRRSRVRFDWIRIFRQEFSSNSYRLRNGEQLSVLP